MILLKLGLYLQTYASSAVSFFYKRPGGVTNYLRPDGTSKYKRP